MDRPTAQQTENQSLNVIRTVAAVMVVVGHARRYVLQPRSEADAVSLVDQALYAATSFGHAGVLLFFVLSGYLIGGGTLARMHQGRFTWREYLTRRLVRLWLVLIPAIALTLVLDRVGVALGGPYYGPGSHAQENSSLVEVLGNVFFLQAQLVEALGTNRSLWSLGYEFAYYVAFPALVLLLARGSAPSTRALNAVLLVVVAAVSGVDAVILFSVWLMGAFVGWHRDRIGVALRGRRGLAVVRVGLVGALGVAAVGTVLQRATQHHVTVSSIVFGLIAAALVATLVSNPRPSSRLAGSAVAGLSHYAHASYTLYAVHLPLIVLVVAVSQQSGRTAPGPVGWLLVVGVTALAMLVSYGLARVTEFHTARVTRAVLARVARPVTTR